MKKVRNIFFIFVFTFAMIALASCTVIDDTHIHCFEDGVCDCGDLEENYPEVKKYKVVLVDGANVIASFEVLEGTLVQVVEAPEKVGQVFAGWFNGDVKWDFNKMPVVGELELEARYVDNAKYEITYQLNGGEFVGEVETTYVSGIGLNKLPEPVRSNYIFLGWYLNGEKVDSISNSQMGSLTLVAKWESVNYDIAYELNGGSFYDGAKIPDNYAEGVGLAELPVARRDSYVFDGWMLEGKLIDAIDPEHVGDVTLSAKWTPVVYTISYQLNDGELLEEATEEYTIEDLVDLPAIQKVGYTFNGWLLNGDKVESIEVGTSGNLVLVADWEVNQYTLTINVDGVKQEVEYDYNEAVEAIVDPAKVGYTFAGWDKAVPAKMPAEDVEIKATWTINQYTLTINVDGVKEEVEYDYNEPVEALEAPTKVGYTFAGWSPAVPAKMPAEDLEVVATWTINQYILTINVDGVKQEVEYDYNEAVEAIEEPAKVGYTFAGWDKAVPAKMPAEDVEIKATWNLVEYTITYESEYGYVAKYPTVDAAIADFLADYNVARGKSHTPETFAALGSWGEISDASLFLYANKAKWGWLVEYISNFAGSANKKAYQNFNNYNSQAELNAANGNYIYSIAYELRGWVGQFKYTKNSNYITADYSDPAVSNAMFGFCKLPEAYTVESEDIILPELSVDGCIFLGWYLGEDKVEKVAQGTTGNLTLVAKWSANVVNVTYDFNGGLSQELYFENGVSTSRIEGTSYNGNFWGEYQTCIFICTQDKDPKALYSERIFVNLNTETGLYEVVSVLASGVTNAWPEGADYVIVLSGSHNNYNGLKGSFANVSVGDIAVFASDVAGASSGSPVEIRFFESAISEDKITKSYHNGGELLSATKPGSTFLGWYDSSDNKYESVDEITEDITLIAKWS